MHHNIQQTVHLLPLPFEVSDIINSFLFHTIETVIKKCKVQICKKINNAAYTRRNWAIFYPNDEEFQETHEHWATCLTCIELHDGIEEIHEEEQFQGINCKLCGNYKQEPLAAVNATCVCPPS